MTPAENLPDPRSLQQELLVRFRQQREGQRHRQFRKEERHGKHCLASKGPSQRSPPETPKQNTLHPKPLSLEENQWVELHSAASQRTAPHGDWSVFPHMQNKEGLGFRAYIGRLQNAGCAPAFHVSVP